MKHTVIRYLKTYGGISFREKPFSPEDALALTVLSYLKMEGLVPGFGEKPAVSIAQLAAMGKVEQMFTDPLYGRVHRHVFLLMAESRRFRNIRLHNYAEWTDGTDEGQFSAVTFQLGETSSLIAFRGTDETLIGWKENFNMSFLPSVPSQRRALSYLQRVAEASHGAIITAGHSKGGNIALYASSFAPEYVQKRIRRIYNFDGPGIQPYAKFSQGYQRIQKKYYKIVPEDSVFGMIFQFSSEYYVVRSYHHGLMQHDILQWIIVGDHFSYITGLRKKYNHLSYVLNYWIASLSTEQISSFVDTLYRLVCASHVKTVYELMSRPFHAWYTFHAEFLHLDKLQKKNFIDVLRRLFLTPFILKRKGGWRKNDQEE